MIHVTPGSTMLFPHPDVARWLKWCERHAVECERHAVKQWNLWAITPEGRNRWIQH